jgi:hypothetical protein
VATFKVEAIDVDIAKIKRKLEGFDNEAGFVIYHIHWEFPFR